MSSESQIAKDQPNGFHLGLLIAGGLLLGTGIVHLITSFGWEGGGFNSNFALIGFHGLDNISVLPDAQFSVPLVVIGALLLIIANATAWKQTDGY